MQIKNLLKNIHFFALFILVSLAAVVGLFLFNPAVSSAANPTTVSFQGKVVNANGTNVTDGTYSVIFRLYNTSSPTTTTACSSDATCLFEETQASVSVTSGVFQVELGSTCIANGGIVGGASDTCTKNTTIDFSSANSLYLTMKFNGDSNGFMTPLIHFNTVPYAYYADNSGKLGSIAAANYVQLATGNLQGDGSNNNSIAINKTSGTGSILQLQKSGSNVLLLDNKGLLTLQPSGSFSGGENALSQTISTGSLSADIYGFSQTISTTNLTYNYIYGHKQAITVNNTGGGANIDGTNISITDSSTNGDNQLRGVVVSVNGNPSSNVTGISSTVNRGNALYANADSGSSVYATTTTTPVTNGTYYGVNSVLSKNGTSQTGVSVYGVSGTVAVSNVTGNFYGGYFSSNAGSALYATNSTGTGKILQLQDNSTDVLLVGDGGATTISPNQDVTAFTVKQTSDTTTPARNIFQVQNSAGTQNFLALNMNGTVPHLKVFGANGTDYADVYYDSSTSTAYFGASTGTAVLGSGTGAVNVTAGSGAAANITANAASTWQTTSGLLTIQGAGGIKLISTGTNGTTLQSTGAATAAFQIQNSTNVTGLAFDDTNFTLKVFDSTGTNYAAISYSGGVATFGANTGTAVLGGGTGSVNISSGSGANVIIQAATGLTQFNTASSNNEIRVYENAASPTNYTSVTYGTISTNSGSLTLQSGGSASLLSNTTNSVSVDSGTTGGVNIGTNSNSKTINIGSSGSVNSTINIGGGFGSSATNQIYIGSQIGSGSVILASGTGGISIGNDAISKTINIGNTTNTSATTVNIANSTSGSSAQTVNIGSTLSTSKTTLQGGVLTATNSSTGIVIGGGYSSSDTSLIPLTLDSSSTFTDTNCTTSANSGTMYFNSTTNTIRACVQSSNSTAGWEDMVTTGGLGLLLYGVVPDSPVNLGNIGDLAGLGASGANSSGPCKVYLGSTTATIRWTGCVAYSGGRKIIVAPQTTDFTVTKATSGTMYVHICLNGTGNQVSQSAVGAENANLPTFSANTPIACLADVQVSTTAVTGIYDVRTFTTSDKDFANIATATTLGLGVPVITSGSNVAAPGASATANIAGVITAWGGATTGAPNAIITIGGPTWAKATAGTAGAVVIPSATAGRVATGTSVAGPYGDLGLQRSATWSATCTGGTASTCQTSIYFSMVLR